MTLPEGGCIDLRLRLDVPRVPRRDVPRPEVALINLDQAAPGESGTSGLMTGIIPTWHASDSNTGQRLVVKPSMWESASAPGLNAALFPPGQKHRSTSSPEMRRGSPSGGSIQHVTGREATVPPWRRDSRRVAFSASSSAFRRLSVWMWLA